jgi:uncharacterized protein YbaR (Trm112 family)
VTCPHCKKELAKVATRCPHCGTRISEASGVFQTSTVLISTVGPDRVYRSVDEVPARLRHRLLKTTNGANSATILIADRKGRKEIDKAMRKLPGPSQRRLVHSLLGDQPVDPMAWFTPVLRKWIAVSVILLAIAVALTVFLYHAKI